MPLVEFDQVERVAVTTLNRPKVRNAVNGWVAVQPSAAVDRIEADLDLRVGVSPGDGARELPGLRRGQDSRTRDAGPEATPDGGFARLVHHPLTKLLVAAADRLASLRGCPRDLREVRLKSRPRQVSARSRSCDRPRERTTSYRVVARRLTVIPHKVDVHYVAE